MGGQEKKVFFSDFGLHALIHREFPKAEAEFWFHLQAPKIYCSWFVESNEYFLLSFFLGILPPLTYIDLHGQQYFFWIFYRRFFGFYVRIMSFRQIVK